MARWVIKTPEDYRKAHASMNARLDRIREEIPTAAVEGIYRALIPTLEIAVRRAPVREGHLRRSGHISIDGARVAFGQPDGSIIDEFTYDAPPQAAEETTLEIGFTVEGGGTGKEGDVNTYAFVQHEHTEFDHPSTVTLSTGQTVLGGEAKFLETAIEDTAPDWRSTIWDHMNEALEDI